MIDSGHLDTGEVEIIGLLPGSSNYTFLARIAGHESEELVIYKPRSGETPLWDFPNGTLCQREVAAHLVAMMTGWDFVPETILREGPLGVGAVQRFIEHDPGFNAFEADASQEPMLRRIALFDLMINNADRKAGHVLRGTDGRLWAIDHGVCFAEDAKLRTVLWDFIGTAIARDDLDAMNCLLRDLSGPRAQELKQLLTDPEIDALRSRSAQLLENEVFPSPGPGRPYPWPPI